MSQPSSDLVDFGGELTEQQPAEVAEMSAPAPVYRKQGFSIYSVMLILSFVFLLVASIILFINVGKYN